MDYIEDASDIRPTVKPILEALERVQGKRRSRISVNEQPMSAPPSDTPSGYLGGMVRERVCRFWICACVVSESTLVA